MLWRVPDCVKIFCCDYFVVKNSSSLHAPSSLCSLCVLCVSVVCFSKNYSTTETQRTQRLHREERLLCLVCLLRLNFVEGMNSSIAISVVLWRVAGAY